MATIKSYNKRLEALKSERSTFIPLWRELSDYHLAHRGRFLTSDRNKGYKRNTKQYNNTSRMAARTLASGMMAGITSPARPWFKLSPGSPELSEDAAVKQWLHDVQEIMYRVFSASNLYNALHQTYAEMGVFGTGAIGIFQDFENVIWCKPYTAGQYMIAANGQNRVDTFYTEYEISVAQCVKQFGKENCSTHVQQMWDRGNTEAWVKIVHLIEPNDDRDMQSVQAKDMPYRSVYYEYNAGTKAGEDKFLRQSGFETFPLLTPRWDVIGEDIYATDCPGITCLGDTKALQLGEKRKYQAVDRVVHPKLQGPSSLRNKVNLNNQDIVWTDSNGNGLTSIYGNWRPDLNAIMAINQEAEQRIQRAFYEDLFLMLANSDRRQITAREVAEKHEEKLLMLGPVLERLHNELLDPLIDRTFDILQKNGVLPVPPEALQNTEINVEYTSVLAQAQQMVAVGGLDAVTGFTAQIAQVWPEARHKVDPMQMVDEYGKAMGVNPSVINSDDVVAERVAAEQQAAQRAQQAEQMQQVANTAKTVSETDMSEEGALGATLRNAGLM